jgi:hypothetical protein
LNFALYPEKKAASATAAEAKAEQVAMKVGVVQAVKNLRPVAPTAMREIRQHHRIAARGIKVAP